MTGRRISFLLLHCVLWGHQREYPWAECEWCLKPGDAERGYVFHRANEAEDAWDIVEPVPTHESVLDQQRPWPTPPGVVIEPTAIIDPPRPAIEA